VGFLQQTCFVLLVGGDRIAFDDEAGGWSGGSFRHRAKEDVDVVGEEVCHALGKMMSLVEAIELHEEP
jgi:hypothetical protein